ncbi:hypothetical protein BTO15_12645 [Polaribacter sejongensis]|uniref:Uncharacterized protein n=1 Tax=Polaribacter sejongensis TaxID=985043 RepID=A0ABN5F8Q0_9FLAO|nr:hypothetical protein BTO15_12645 [Polaribacter sejongensis]
MYFFLGLIFQYRIKKLNSIKMVIKLSVVPAFLRDIPTKIQVESLFMSTKVTFWSSIINS